VRLATSRLVALLALAAGACSQERRAPEVGQPAPSYSAESLDGAAVDLAALKGKVVLLNVWATWCAPCREEIPFLQTLYDRHRGDGFEVIGVSTDTRGQDEAIREFAADFRMTYPIWRDPDERVQTLFFALGVPASYLIDREGVLRWKRLGIVRATDSTFTRALAASLGGQ
jgi:cytochrome c biogenesis protein CcmG, thiol:disulfide interchange protein DsbE